MFKKFKHVHCPECKNLVGYYKHQLKSYKSSQYFDCPICSKDVHVETFKQCENSEKFENNKAGVI